MIETLEKWRQLEEKGKLRELPPWLQELREEYDGAGHWRIERYCRELEKPMTTELELELLSLCRDC